MPIRLPLLAMVGVGADEHASAAVVEDHLVEIDLLAPQSAQGWSNVWISKG